MEDEQKSICFWYEVNCRGQNIFLLCFNKIGTVVAISQIFLKTVISTKNILYENSKMYCHINFGQKTANWWLFRFVAFFMKQSLFVFGNPLYSLTFFIMLVMFPQKTKQFDFPRSSLSFKNRKKIQLTRKTKFQYINFKTELFLLGKCLFYRFLCMLRLRTSLDFCTLDALLTI